MPTTRRSVGVSGAVRSASHTARGAIITRPSSIESASRVDQATGMPSGPKSGARNTHRNRPLSPYQSPKDLSWRALTNDIRFGDAGTDAGDGKPEPIGGVLPQKRGRAEPGTRGGVAQADAKRAEAV